MTLKRYRVTDKVADLPEVYTTKKLGHTQALTPEGFLLCTGVPIKRLGDLLYGPNEVPITPGPDGVSRVTRDAASLFSPETIASYQGKPVVVEHPDVDVSPTNWKQLAVGICLNPRRGVGDDADVLLADLLITDGPTIRAVQAGKREVSAGYEADYEQTGPGRGRQTSIIGNHIALVDRGRCGPRCAIGDHQPTSLKENHMGIKTRRRISDRALDYAKASLRRVFRDAEEEALNALGNSGLEGDGAAGTEAIDDTGPGGDDDNHIHVHLHQGGEAGAPAAADGPDAGGDVPDDPVEARFQSLESGHAQIMEQIAALTEAIQGLTGGAAAAPAAPDAGPAPVKDDMDGEMVDNPDPSAVPDGAGPADDSGDMPEGKTKDRATVGDSAALASSFQQLVSDAEVLLPGYRVPTLDAALPRAKTIDRMCALRKSVLDSIYLTPSGKSLVDGVSGTTELDTGKMTCQAAAVLFRSAASVKRMLNNRASTADAGRLPSPTTNHTGSNGATSIAALNDANKKFWAARQGAVK